MVYSYIILINMHFCHWCICISSQGYYLEKTNKGWKTVILSLLRSHFFFFKLIFIGVYSICNF